MSELTGHAEPHGDEWDARCVSCGQSFGIGDGWSFINAAVACPYCGALHDVICDTQGDGQGYWFVAERSYAEVTKPPRASGD